MTVLTRCDDAHWGQSAPLIVHSHLRWDFVWQRPQQILTRMACKAPVLFVEEPLFLDDIGHPTLDVTLPHINVYRAVPHLPASMSRDYDEAIAEVRSLVLARLSQTKVLGGVFSNPIQWFYTPMAAPAMLGAFHERGVVYDCMDELSQFRFAHPDLVRRERLLIDSADVVFTGGHRLYQAKARYHDNVHFFGCGVDVKHFASARDAATVVPDDIASIPRPIAGYYGVIDERLDYDLIARLAASKKDLQVVMIGPTAKVDPAELPKAPNIHWLGGRDYDLLPAYVKRFNVCLMPFALNEATEYINPTKTLEYMAAGKPIVSTAVADVIHNFAPVVSVARNADEFVAQVARLAAKPDQARIAAGLQMARGATWDAVVDDMAAIMIDAVFGDSSARTPLPAAAAAQQDDTVEELGLMTGTSA